VKIWQKDVGVNQRVEAFTVGRDREMDAFLAQYDLEGSMAHVTMLASVGLLQADELPPLLAALRALHAEAKEGRFHLEEGVEDVHSQVELLLTRQLGELGKKIHSGRSRNDQVLVDLRLFFRAEMRQIAELCLALFARLQLLSETHKNELMPGYTHLQVAMVSSFGLWFGAYAEALVDDMRLLKCAYRLNNQNPLGSAAGYGSSFPLDRTLTTNLLGFNDLCYNVVNAQMGRGKTELHLAFALAGMAHTLAKLAMDVTLFISQNFGFIAFPEELTTGSSIMPHKKNPDVFELLRGKCNLLMALPQQVLLLTSNLPSGYHRDFQLLKEAVFPAIQELKNCLSMAEFSFSQIIVHKNITKEDKYKYLFTVEAVNEKVLQGTPFRDAYREVGLALNDGNFVHTNEVRHTHEGSIGNLCTDKIKSKMDKVWADFDFGKAESAIDALVKGQQHS
jgi:argininosuccinate lyase